MLPILGWDTPLYLHRRDLGRCRALQGFRIILNITELLLLPPECPGFVGSPVHRRRRTMFASAPCCTSVSPLHRGGAQGDDGVLI